MTIQKESRRLARDLRALPDEECVNPKSVNRSLSLIREAEAAVVKAQECLVDVVQQERREWNLGLLPTTPCI